MTLCDSVSQVSGLSCESTYHLERPYPPYPHLQLALDAPHVIQFDALPPASPSGFPPEEKQFLRHADSIAVRQVVTLDVSSKTC